MTFASWPDVVVPDVVRAYSSERVLTMSFEAGVNGTQRAQIEASGVDAAKASRLVSRAFCAQTFTAGFVHCDPYIDNILPGVHSRSQQKLLAWSCLFFFLHSRIFSRVSFPVFSFSSPCVALRHAANVLVRAGPRGAPTLVLLDHGLYRELDADFRLEYARLWRALALGDTRGIAASAHALGVGEFYPLFAAMLTQRPWDDIANPDLNSLRADAAEGDGVMIRGYAQRYAREITLVLDKVPRQLLLLLKMSDCLRHLERALGGQVNTHVITAHACADALYAHDKDWRSYLKVKSRLWAHDAREAWRHRTTRHTNTTPNSSKPPHVAVPENVSSWGATSSGR